jgi:16S rRNA (guanine(966)-N(2))-methyltransferase RsmD
VRVTGGRLGGRVLKSPPSRSREVRPSSDRTRETLFALLGDVSDLAVLDLFCGTGALAVEALSRGADSAILVDRAPALARRNVEELGLARRCEVVRADAVRYLRRARQTGRRFGLILCDPPYRLADRLEPELAEHLPPLLARYGRLAVESSARRPLDLGLPAESLRSERRIGEALIRIWAPDG